MENESNLEELKERYKEIQNKYNLPDFDELNKDFSIEKICETETDYLIREIRKYISDKFSNYLRFIETLLHPVNTPMFVFSIVKTLGTEEKNKLSEIYKILIKNEVKLIKLDINFSEFEEALFIKESYSVWKKIKKDLLDIVNSIELNWDNKLEMNENGYFG